VKPSLTPGGTETAGGKGKRERAEEMVYWSENDTEEILLGSRDKTKGGGTVRESGGTKGDLKVVRYKREHRGGTVVSNEDLHIYINWLGWLTSMCKEKTGRVTGPIWWMEGYLSSVPLSTFANHAKKLRKGDIKADGALDARVEKTQWGEVHLTRDRRGNSCRAGVGCSPQNDGVPKDKRDDIAGRGDSDSWTSADAC